MRTRVFLADDHTMLLDAYRKLLEDRYDVVGVAADGRELLANAPAARPDIIVLDIAMPFLNGLDAAVRLREMLPATRLIFVTMNEDPALGARALSVGASGYLLKTDAGTDLVKAIEAVEVGKTYVTPTLAGEVFALARAPGAARPKLTPRQREVVQLVAEGRPMKEIADILGVSARTVAFHKYAAMEALGAETTAELIRHAVREGLVPG